MRNHIIDINFLEARKSYAIGRKILSSDGGNFSLFYIAKVKQEAVIRSLPSYISIKINM